MTLAIRVEGCFGIRSMIAKQGMTFESCSSSFDDGRLILALLASMFIHSSTLYFLQDNQAKIAVAYTQVTRTKLSIASINSANEVKTKSNLKTVKTNVKVTPSPLAQPLTTKPKTEKKWQKKTTKAKAHQNQDKSLAAKQAQSFPDMSADPGLSEELMPAKKDLGNEHASSANVKSDAVQEHRHTSLLVSGQQHNRIDLNPRFLSPPRPPIYPRRSIRRNQQGTTLIRAKISRLGKVEQLNIYQSSGYDDLDHAALAAVKKWAFEPAKRNGVTTASWVQVPVNFILN